MKDVLKEAMEIESSPEVGSKFINERKRPRELSYESIARWFGHLHPEPGMITRSYPGYYGVVNRLLRYASEKIRYVMAPSLSSDLTVCNSYRRMMYHLGWLLYAIFLMLFLTYTSYPDGKMGDYNSGNDCCSNGQNFQMCNITSILNNSLSDFRFLISFVLAGYVGLVVSTWLTRRRNYATCIGISRNLTALFAVYIPDEIIDVRRKLCRWVKLVFELAVLDARGGNGSVEALEFLRYERLVEIGEWEKMVPNDRHTTVILWILMELEKLKASGIVINNEFFLIDQVCALRANCTDIKSSLALDNPFPYVHLVGLLVKANIFIYSTKKAADWSKLYFTYGPTLFTGGIQMYVDFAVLVMWNMSYAGFFDLGHSLSNPFLDRRIDVPHELISAGLTDFIDALSSPEGISKHTYRRSGTKDKRLFVPEQSRIDIV